MKRIFSSATTSPRSRTLARQWYLSTGVSLLSGGSDRLDTRLDTPPSINRRHPDYRLALLSQAMSHADRRYGVVGPMKALLGVAPALVYRRRRAASTVAARVVVGNVRYERKAFGTILSCHCDRFLGGDRTSAPRCSATHMVEADAGEAEASLNALLDDETSKLRILDYLRKWLGDKSTG